MDRRFIRRYLGFDPVHQLVRRLHRRLYLRDRQFIRRCLLFSFSCSGLTLCLILAFLHGIFLHPWDLEMSTKTCSNNMVSPNDHVVMNNQNQTPNKWHMRPCSLQCLSIYLLLCIICPTMFSNQSLNQWNVHPINLFSASFCASCPNPILPAPSTSGRNFGVAKSIQSLFP
jgi:hypothetical protein